MCLSLPAYVEQTVGLQAVVRIGQTKRTVLNPIDARPKDTVLVQQGVIVDKIEKKEKPVVMRVWQRALKKKKKPN